MKEKVIVLMILMFPFFVMAQEEQESTGDEMRNLYADLGVGQRFNMEETVISFIKVISDSRCPKEVTCIWPGEARILVGIENNGDYFEKEIVVSGGGVEFPLANNISVQFSSLRPYPKTGAKIAAEEYCLRFSALVPAGD